MANLDIGHLSAYSKIFPNLSPPPSNIRAYIWDSVCIVRTINDHGQSIYRACKPTCVLTSQIIKQYYPAYILRIVFSTPKRISHESAIERTILRVRFCVYNVQKIASFI